MKPCECGEELLKVSDTVEGEMYACHICGRICIETDQGRKAVRGPVYSSEERIKIELRR